MYRLMLCALCLTLASGCSTVPSPIPSAVPPIPASLMEPCPDLEPLRHPTMPALAVKLIEVSGRYYQCQARQKALSEAVRNRDKGD